MSIFSPRSIYQAFQGFFVLRIHVYYIQFVFFFCNNHNDNVTYEIMAALTVQ